MQADDVDYVVTAFHASVAHLQLIFYKKGEAKGIPFSIEVKKDDLGNYPSGAALDAMIRSYIPWALMDSINGPCPPIGMIAVEPNPSLFDVGVVFITREQQSLFAKRSLFRINGLPIAVDLF